VTQPLAPGLSLRFGVKLDDYEIGTFTGCSGLDAQYEVLEWREGGDNGSVARLSGRLSHSNIKLTRSVDANSGTLAAWFSQQQRQPTRSNAAIRLFDGNHNVVATWTVEGAWPVRYSGPVLTAGPAGDAIAVESLELAHEGFTWQTGEG
jgi:phage tail-like protein